MCREEVACRRTFVTLLYIFSGFYRFITHLRNIEGKLCCSIVHVQNVQATYYTDYSRLVPSVVNVIVQCFVHDHVLEYSQQWIVPFFSAEHVIFIVSIKWTLVGCNLLMFL